MSRFLFLLVFFALALSPDVAGQNYSTGNRKAIRSFNKAKSEMHSDAEKALSFAKRAIELDQNFSEAYILLAEIYIENKEEAKARHYLKKMLSFNPDKYPSAWLLLGDLQFGSQKYKNALSSYDTYLSMTNDTLSLKGKPELASFRDSLMNHPADIHLSNIGTGINSSGCEFANAISLDGQRLYFTLKPEGVPAGGQQKWDEDFYFSILKDSVWQPAKSLGDQINTPYNEGAMHLSSDGRFLFYTSCRGLQGFGSCDLYFARRINDTTWEESFNLGGRLNTRHWETQPCFSSDGRTLFFVSTREGGQGGADIWMARLREGGGWTYPENLGKKINTKGEEMAPYLHPDGKTLYFSSNGHLGMGGQDLFMTRMKADSTWTQPRNLGYPINNDEDQINLIVNAEGNQAYISSTDSAGFGCYDIFTFKLPDPLQPNPAAYLQGIVFDSVTNQPLEASIELIDLKTKHTVVVSASREDGSYIVALPSGNDYALHVDKEDYLFYSDHFPFNSNPAEVMVKDIPLQPIKEDALIELKNIFFAFDSDSLKPSSETELNKLVHFLEKNQELSIRIEGHTDNRGAAEYNKKLSERRAFAVMNYLLENNIRKSRLDIKGFGEESPRATNETEKGRAKNRRTEIRIVDVQME